jgi:UDP-N-acetylglucosamine diphosphorylase / glucose-1-phosphate thymidylyltransferase / UDP-N-acetylgalactosamine diphosphorylase / glucosamine-1-phosphate N-acetyltransferase / galactosamine-1-phosphate N-acetyltransferase
MKVPIPPMLHPSSFFTLTDPLSLSLFEGSEYAWEPLKTLSQHVTRLVGAQQTILGDVHPGAYLSDAPIYIGKGAVVEPGAYIIGPAYIGEGTVVRHGAYIRENVIMLAGSVLGHASEAKHSILLPSAHAPHFAYVGDSILGQRVNLGAGTKLSNLTINSEKDLVTGKRPMIKIWVEDKEYDTGLAKLGAILGDDVQTGCNSVLNPGCLIGPRTLVYANASVRKGYFPSDSIIKLRQNLTVLGRKS